MQNRLKGILVAGIIAVTGQPMDASAWELTRSLDYPATAECLGENLCVFVSCPAQGRPSLEMMIYEHSLIRGDEISVEVDGNRFPLTMPERGENELYRWSLAPDVADAIMKGHHGEVRIDPQVDGWTLPLRGSGVAIGDVLAKCDASSEASIPKGEDGRLSGLSPETDCLTATTTGVVVDRELNAAGTEIAGFHLRDDYGVSYINVDPPENRAVVQRQLLDIIVPKARLKAELHGCGAAARIEVLSSVELVN